VVSLLIAHLLATFVNIAAGVIAVRAEPRANAARMLLGIALFGLGLTHQAIQRADLLHVAFVAFISLGMLPMSLLVIGSRYYRRSVGRRDALLAVATVLVFLLAIVPELVFHLRQVVGLTREADRPIFLVQHGRSFPLRTMESALRAGQMLTWLDAKTSSGQRLFVGPADLRRTNYTDTWIYHMMPQLRPATYFLEMNPLSANRPGSRLAADVASADWLVLNREWDSWDEKNKSSCLGSDAPSQVIAAQFKLRGHYGPYDIYQRRTAILSNAVQSGPGDKVF